MEISRLKNNAEIIQEELAWFQKVLSIRFEQYFNDRGNVQSIYDIPSPDISNSNSAYAEIIHKYNFREEERLVILLALAPHIAPQILDIFFANNTLYGRQFTEFGGVKGSTHSGFLPTAETAVFLLAGKDLTKRFETSLLFDSSHPLMKFKIIELDTIRTNEPKLSRGMSISEEFLHYFTSGSIYKPDFSSKFPAKLLTTKLNWEDLVLADFIMNEVKEIQAWLEHATTIMETWGLGNRIKEGYRAMFYGPPGTGKTLTASLIGKSLDLDVYRVDLSQVVSKYIGETEKNMANIFDQAENKNWILFFDEADALFGKRTNASDSRDRHANQEVAYLLQRVEDFPGVVILASNLKSNIDKAFARRFQASIHFPMPDQRQRFLLWTRAFDGNFDLDGDIDFEAISYDYVISGGGIINVLRYCAISALRRGSNCIARKDIIQGISKEFAKEGKMI